MNEISVGSSIEAHHDPSKKMLLEPTLNEMSKNGCNFNFKNVSTITDMSDINFSKTHFASARIIFCTENNS